MASTENTVSTAMVNTVTASADIFLLLPPVDLSAIIFRNCVRSRYTGYVLHICMACMCDINCKYGRSGAGFW